MSRGLTVFAPASTGNLSVGFDALGLALAPVDGTLLGDLVHLKNTNQPDWTLKVTGPFEKALPEDPEENVVMTCCRRFESVARNFIDDVFPLDVTLEKNAFQWEVAWVQAPAVSLQRWLL